MKILKKWWFWVIVAVLILTVVFGTKNDESKAPIESITIQESYTDITIDADALFLKNGYVHADVKRGSASYDDLENLIEFVVEDESIAKIKSLSFDESDSTHYTVDTTCELEGVKSGKTTGYFQTVDGTVKSSIVSITVEGINNDQAEFIDLINKPLSDAIAKTNELGYTATYLHASSGLDFTGEIPAFDNEELSKWVIVDCNKTDFEEKSVEFTINTIENIEAEKEAEAIKETLSATLDTGHAWQAVKSYGETLYPYGFDLHYIMGALATEAKDENTWFLKATVTITNEYNAKAELECEAYVTGTNDNPIVEDFKVY